MLAANKNLKVIILFALLRECSTTKIEQVERRTKRKRSFYYLSRDESYLSLLCFAPSGKIEQISQ